MGVKINLNHQAIEKAAQQLVTETARRAQPELDQLHRSHAGRPVAEIEPRIKVILGKYGMSLNDPRSIREYASAIAEGTRIVLKS